MMSFNVDSRTSGTKSGGRSIYNRGNRMNTLKLVPFLLLCMICVITAGCGAGNMEMRRTETTGFDEDSTQADENNSTAAYRVQIGIFDNRIDAYKLAETARSKIDYSVYVVYIAPFYRVRVGDFVRKSDAEECVVFLKQKGFSDSRYVYKYIISQ